MNRQNKAANALLLTPAQGEELNRKSLLLLTALTLSTVELFFPRIPIFPWLKPGLTNAVTMVWLIRYGLKEAYLYLCIRLFISSFFFGISFFTLILAVGGGFTALSVMGILYKTGVKRELFGIWGMAMAGAFAHNIGQLAILSLLMRTSTALHTQTPFMAAAAVGFGFVTAKLALLFLQAAQEDPALVLPTGKPDRQIENSYARTHITAIILLLLLCASLIFINSFTILLITAFLIGSITLIASRSPAALVIPFKRMWIMFLFTAFYQLLNRHGERIPAVPFLTYTGVNGAILFSLKLWIWLECTGLFRKLNFHACFFKLTKKIFSKHNASLEAGLFAAEFFPAIVSSAFKEGPALLKQIFKKPASAAAALTKVVKKAYQQASQETRKQI